MPKTSIGWVINRDGSQGHSVNPIRFRNLETGKVGHHCEKVSPGCANCYASAMQKPYLSGLDFVAENQSKGEFFLDLSVLRIMIRRRQPTTYFWGDMTDLFGSWVPDEWLDWCLGVAAITPQHRHIFLTKRAARLPEYFGAKRFSMGGIAYEELVSHCEFWDWVTDSLPATGYNLMGHIGEIWRWPLPNVVLGVSCEDQAAADERIPHLLATPAACRMVSLEPLLGPINLYSHIPTLEIERETRTAEDRYLDWVIVGGESGPGARSMHPDWARWLRDQCENAGVPFFFKQWGEWLGAVQDGAPGDGQICNCSDWPVRVGKRAAGRLLDGRVWDERPEVLR